jgi:hypothetical protein
VHPRMEPASPKTKSFQVAGTLVIIELASKFGSIQRTA